MSIRLQIFPLKGAQMILLELYEQKQQLKRIIFINWLQITTLPQLSIDWLTWRETESSALRTCACSPLWTSRYPHQINNNWFFFQYDHVFIFKMFTFTTIQLTSLLLKTMTLKRQWWRKGKWPQAPFSGRSPHFLSDPGPISVYPCENQQTQITD